MNTAIIKFIFFFFSSRRRHTRFDCDWSSDVCSSDLAPNLNEGDFAIQALRIPGTSLTQSLEMQIQIENTLKKEFPEIDRVFARTGTAEIASDPMPPNISDGYIMLKQIGRAHV